MSDENASSSGNGEDNELIRSLRKDLAEAQKGRDDAVAAAVAQVERKFTARQVLGDQFASLAPYLAQEVEGDITTEAAAKWLADKGLAAAPPTTEEEDTPSPSAQALQSVTDLASSAAAQVNANAGQSLSSKLNELEKNSGTMTLQEFARAVGDA